MRLITVLILSLVFLGCTENVQLSESKEEGTFNTSDDLIQCNCDSLAYDLDSNFVYKDKPFTGICYSYYPNTKDRYMEKNFLEGQLHGKVKYFDKEGSILVEEEYVNGVNTKAATEGYSACDCSELELKPAPGIDSKIRYRNNHPFTGVCYEYYPNSDVLYLKQNIRDGVPHGFTEYFDKEGQILFTEEYDYGNLKRVVKD